MSKITNESNTDLGSIIPKNKATSIHKITDLLSDAIESRKAAEANELKLKTALKELLKIYYFKYNTNAEELDEVVHTFDLNDLQINFVNQYFIKNKELADQLIELLGSKHPLADEIAENVSIKVNVTGLSDSEAESLTKLITEDAVEFGVTPEVERVTNTSPDFHSLRHIVLTEEDNLKLDEILPLQTQVALIE